MDLQDPPELLEEMYNKIILGNANIVYAQRAKTNEKFLKKLHQFCIIKYLIFYQILKYPSKHPILEFSIKKFFLNLKNLKKKIYFIEQLFHGWVSNLKV